MKPAEKKRYFEFVASLPCANCGKSGVEVSHYQGISDHYLGRCKSQKSHDLAVCPLCPDCHDKADKYMLFNYCEDNFANKLSHSEGMLRMEMQTIIKASEAGVISI